MSQVPVLFDSRMMPADLRETLREARRQAEIDRILGSIPVPVTSDAILFLVRRRVEELDTQVNTITADIEHVSREAQALAGRIAERRELQHALQAVPRNDRGEWQFTEEHAALQARMTELGISARGPEDLQRVIDGLNEELRQMNSGNELRMVNLQSVMQQRTAVIQLGSNLLKALDEAADSVIGNIR